MHITGLTLFGLGELQLQLGVVGDEGHERGSQAKGPGLNVNGGCLLMHACSFIQLSCILQGKQSINQSINIYFLFLGLITGVDRP